MNKVGAVLAALASAAFLALPAASAQAVPTLPPHFFQSPAEGSDARSIEAGKLNIPQGIVSDPSGQRVYISDVAFQERVNVFGPWGQFREAFGWGVKDGANEFQRCTSETGCQAAVAGAGRGQFHEPIGMAVDSAGNLYVVDGENHRVQKFSPTGEFLFMFGGGVNETSGGNICPRPGFPADVCKAGSTGSAAGQFEPWLFGNFITVGAGNVVYVGDKDRIQAFNPDGSFKSEIKFADVHAAFPAFPATGDSGSLAYDPVSGDLYFAFYQLGVTSHSLSPNVYKLTPAGAVADILTIDTPSAIAPETGPDAEGNVFAVELSHPNHNQQQSEILEFDASGNPVGVVGIYPSNLPPLGLGTNRVGNLQVTVGNGTSPRAFLDVYGPPPSEIEPAPEVSPTVVDQFAVSASSSAAVVKAMINPHFFGSTTYRVEYGLGPCEGGGCATTASQALGGGERSEPLPTAAVPLPGLEADTTYHFRFVATSGESTVKGAEGTFTTRRAGTPALPDARAYEKVSPADKNGGEAGLRFSRDLYASLGGFGEDEASRPVQAAPSGDAIAFPSLAIFGDAAAGPGTSQYVSRRTESGWETENVTPAARGFSLKAPVRGLSPDLSHLAVVQSNPPLVPEASPNTQNLYIRDQAGAVTLLTPDPQIEGIYCLNFGGATPDFSRVVFLAKNATLTPDTPAGKGQSLYEWSANDGLALVSILPDGTPAPPSDTTGFGSRRECTGEGNAANAVSADGDRIFWSFGGSYEGISNPLFVRLNGTETIELDIPESGIGPAGGGTFWAASADGSKVFFTAPGKLTSDASNGDLYRYDFDAPEGERLTDLSAGPEAAQVLGILGASENGSSIYLAAKGALSEEENSEGDKAKAGKANIYLWKEGVGIRFVGAADPLVDGSELPSWGNSPFVRTARVSPDGGFLAFASTVPLTGFDSRDQQSNEPDPEVFLYDAAKGELTCASCSPVGARPVGAASLPPWGTPFQPPQQLSDEGRLFFQSKDALAQKDQNGKQDIYEFELPGSGSCSTESLTYVASLGGCQDLISSGESTDHVYLDDASPNGNDVFFATRQRLLPSDGDDHFDVYDARVNGGLPEPSPAPPCAGEGCRPSPTPPPGSPAPASSGFSGSGNVKEAAKARKHKAKKHKGRKGHGKRKKAKAQQGGRR